MQLIVSERLAILLPGMTVRALPQITLCASCAVTLRHSQLVLNTHLPASDAQLIHEFQVSPQLLATDFTGEQSAIMAYGLHDLLRGFVKKFKAEMPDTQRQKS